MTDVFNDNEFRFNTGFLQFFVKSLTLIGRNNHILLAVKNQERSAIFRVYDKICG